MLNLLAQLAYGLLAMTICLPSMQAWPGVFEASQAAVQLTFSGYIAAYGCLQLVWGPLSDRLGRRPVLLAGLVIAVAGAVLAALAPSLGLLTVARLIQGAGCAAGMVAGRAMVQDYFAGAERTRMMAFVGMTMGLCPPAATLLGGQIHVHLGWQGNFVLMAALGVVLLVAAWRLPVVARPPSTGGGVPALVAGYARLAREPAFLLHVVMLSSLTAAFYTFLGGTPLVLAGYGVPPQDIGWTIMAIPGSYIVGNALTTRLVHRIGDRRLMTAGQVATHAGILGVLAFSLAGWNTPWSLALPLVLMGIGHGLLVPPTLAGTVGLIPALAGAAAAVGGVMQQLVGALAGFVVGLVPHHGAAAMGVLMLGWTLLGLMAQIALVRIRPRTAGG